MNSYSNDNFFLLSETNFHLIVLMFLSRPQIVATFAKNVESRYTVLQAKEHVQQDVQGNKYIQDGCINDEEFDNMADIVQKLNIQK